MIRSHQELILNYFRAKKEFSSRIVEGFHNKAKLTIRKSYGFRSDKLRDIALYHMRLVIYRFLELPTDLFEEAKE